MQPKLELKRKYVLSLGNWLMNLSLLGRESRERTKFLEQLNDELAEQEKIRLSIVEKYADKKEGKPEVKDTPEGTKFSFTPENLAKFNTEYNDYLAEDFVLESAGNIQRLKIIKSIVLDTQEKISPSDAFDYDQWCEAFEKVQF